ncbi:MAG: SDR family oxidoreductase [Gammaproteobacteria bacterium]|nr:SDR family oxidoreductase [Gammaproteobacteria bacterium]
MTQSLFDLGGRIAVVTGASSGIGRAMAGFLAAAGARMVLVARRQDLLDQAVITIEQADGKAATVAGDLAERDSIPAIAAKCREFFGHPHILVNAAGINLRQAAQNITAEGWDRTIDLNLSVPFFLAREFVPGMQEHGYGRIINIASLQSVRAFPDSIAYGASKGGVCQLTRAMAEAWSGDGITCNAIAPGFFPTELTATVFDNPERRTWAAGQTAIGRNGELEDLAGISIFLAAPAAGYITGQTIFVDGGFTAT